MHFYWVTPLLVATLVCPIICRSKSKIHIHAFPLVFHPQLSLVFQLHKRHKNPAVLWSLSHGNNTATIELPDLRATAHSPIGRTCTVHTDNGDIPGLIFLPLWERSALSQHFISPWFPSALHSTASSPLTSLYVNRNPFHLQCHYAIRLVYPLKLHLISFFVFVHRPIHCIVGSYWTRFQNGAMPLHAKPGENGLTIKNNSLIALESTSQISRLAKNTGEICIFSWFNAADVRGLVMR